MRRTHSIPKISLIIHLVQIANPMTLETLGEVKRTGSIPMILPKHVASLSGIFVQYLCKNYMQVAKWFGRYCASSSRFCWTSFPVPNFYVREIRNNELQFTFLWKRLAKSVFGKVNKKKSAFDVFRRLEQRILLRRITRTEHCSKRSSPTYFRSALESRTIG